MKKEVKDSREHSGKHAQGFEPLDSASAPVLGRDEYLSKIQLFREKCRDSDVIRYVMGSERLLTVGNIGDSENGSMLCLWSLPKSGELTSSATAAIPPELIWEKHFEDGINPIVPSPDGNLVAIGTRGLLGVYAVGRAAGSAGMTAVGYFIIENESPILAVSFSDSDRRLEMETADGLVRRLEITGESSELRASSSYRKSGNLGAVMAA